MRPGYGMAALMVGLIVFVMISQPAHAGTSGYCLECHSQRWIERFDRDTGRSPSEDRSVYQAKLDLCPGLRSLSEEIFFTESRIVQLDRVLRSLERDGSNTDNLKKGISESAESLSDLKGERKGSVEQLSKEASAARAALQKIYARILHVREEASRRWLIGLGCLFLLGLLVLLGLGYRKLGHMGKTLSVYLLVGGLLSLGTVSCVPSPPESSKTGNQERLEKSLSVAGQITRQMEETFYLSCLLAEMSREWARIEPSASERGFQLAWQTSLDAREKAGKVGVLKEIVSRWPDREKALREGVLFEKVLDLRDEIRNARGRTWALRAVAEEWIRVNPKGGRSALDFATKEALAMEDSELRDRELRAMAEAWAGIDGNRSVEIARSIADPFLKVLALTHAALSENEKGRAENLLKEAWKSAEAIAPSYPQARAMTEVSVAASLLFPQEKKGWMDRTLLEIQRLKSDPLRAFAMEDLVVHWTPLDFEQAKRLAMEIPSTCPAERAYALIYLAKNGKVPGSKALILLKEASSEMLRVSDPFESRKLKGLIGKEAARLDPGEAIAILPKVKDPFYRSEILSILVLTLSKQDKKKALDLAETIPDEPFRIRARVSIVSQSIDREREKAASLYQETLQAAAAIADPYTRALFLIDLEKNWGRIERGMRLKLLEPALASAERISSPWMRIEVVEAIAEVLKNEDPARARVLLNGIEPPLLRLYKALEEVQRWADVDPQKAEKLAEEFSSDFPFEKAMAFKAAAGGLKGIDPRRAYESYEKAIEQVLMLPEGHRGRSVLSSLIGEAGRLDRERTCRRIRQVNDPETRDFLLRETGSAWVREDPSFALKVAGEITEGPVRLSLYQKIADEGAKRPSVTRRTGVDEAGLRTLTFLGRGREKAKKDEQQAIPYYEKALKETIKAVDPKERSFLLCALAAEWSLIDEERAFAVAESIPADFPEPLSHALLQIGSQFKKWDRKRAGVLFQKSASAAAWIREPELRARRLLEIGRQWRGIDPGKGEEVLKIAGNERRKEPSSEKGDLLLTKILLCRSADVPDPLSVLQSTDGPLVRARVLLEQGRARSRTTVEASMEIMEKALIYAQKAKHPRLLTELAVLWYAFDPAKASDICSQIDPIEHRVRCLCWMAEKAGKGGESKLLLEKAVQESLQIRGVTGKIGSLKEIARILADIDKEKAKSVYQIAYQVMKRSTL